jgi:Flp pilus assembly pilin Flp
MRNKRAQSVIEYLLIFTMIGAAIAASGFVTSVKDIFKNHFNSCKEKILSKS